MNHDLSDSFRVPRAFGPFRVLHQIGVGVLGPVYRAQADADAALVAIKALRLDIPPEQAAEVANALVDLAAEWPMGTGLVDVLAAGLEGETPWLGMRLLEAPTLDMRLREGRAIALEAGLAGVLDLAAAIDAAHAEQIVHGSLHPRDVFVEPDGRVRVTGFGIARILRRVGVRPPTRCPCTAPETLSDVSVGPAADLFAMGALTFEWLTGRRPSGLGAEAAAHFDVEAPPEALAHARTIVAAMLAEQPGHRPGSATAFAQALAHALDVPLAHRTPVFLAPGAGRAAADTIDRSGLGHEAPSEDALRLFATQGTLWEAPRPREDWRQDAGDPDDLDLELDPPEPAFDTHRDLEPEPEPAQPPWRAEVSEAIAEPVASPLGLRTPFRPASEEAEPDFIPASLTAAEEDAEFDLANAMADDRVPGRHQAADSELAPEPSAPPGVVLVLTLALGLAIGGAGGYLLGQRSAARAQERAAVSLPPAAEEPRPIADEPRAIADSAPQPPSSSEGPGASRSAQVVGAAAPPARPRAVTGELIVRSTPVKAGVVINNVWRGRTPLTLDSLPLGTHTVRVVERGYVPETRRVVLDARVPSATISIQLARAASARAPAASAPRPGATTGSLFVESRPSGARVFVNGNLVGTTPLLVSEIAPGARAVRLEHPGHRAWTTTVDIAAGQRQRVAASLEEGS